MIHTLAAACRHEEIIKRSRFVAQAAPVSSEAETLSFYESVADPAANHNCWAWRLDFRYRFNDDGEPSGTAGRPILVVLEGRELDQVMVIVTRYFGGIKLGVGGLARAYSGCAAKCLDRARLVPLVQQTECLLEAGFEHADAVHRVLAQFSVNKNSETFDQHGLKLTLEVPSTKIRALEEALRDASRGVCRLRPVTASGESER